MPKLDPVLAFAVGGIGTWVWDIQDDVIVGDATFAKLMNFEDAGRPLPLRVLLSAIHPSDAPALRDALDQVGLGDDAYMCVFRKAGSLTSWLMMKGAVTARDAKGSARILTGVIWDASDQQAQLDRLAILASEMDHRVKNAFAVIRALISMAMRTSPDHASFGAALKSQVTALATAHSVTARLAREAGNAQTAVPLSDVLETSLAPWRGGHDIRIGTPDDLLFAPQEVPAVSMLIYELAMNAAKHGVLGTRGGQLSISARIAADGNRQIIWEEDSATPLPIQNDTSAVETGFGTVLVDHCAKTLDATVMREFRDRGLIVTLALKPLTV